MGKCFQLNEAYSIRGGKGRLTDDRCFCKFLEFKQYLKQQQGIDIS